ncbi:MAG: Glycine--tRNA ligase beta subunit [Syntrophorhabdaceae bacterium PtaU1.Bin034]|nr:MAG: Glycine--tRNA ligase beta subunit [Syntrophorhabdaceae bacterium PtaU1.Bin034]
MKPFLLEIGTEELPARFIKPAKEGLLRLLKEGLEGLRIGHGEIKIYGTPRRIAVIVDGMEEKQQETVTVKFGPPAARAYDAEGKPLPAATGFAKSQGVDVAELKIRKKESAELICVEKVETGKPAAEVLAGLLPDVITRIPFQKKMRWGQGNFEFGRPVHWVVALLGEDVIRFNVAGITSGNTSKGHRFLSKGEMTITDVGRYIEDMRANHIIVDEEERMAMMLNDIRTIEAKTGAKAVTDEDLMEEIRYITEYPYGLMGRFEEEYLDLPRAVLVNVMKGHQRYIPLEEKDGSLLAGFIFFANTVPVTPDEVIRGNEKVLRARLADAQFFFEEDKKIKLDTLYEKLEAVMFHKRLGNLKDKVERVRRIGLYLSSALDLPLGRKVERAAKVIKADLLTHMVGEFPELQGSMGRIYAEYQGEDREVALSIEEHYYPIGTDATLPETDLGSLMALTDKMDSLISFFSVGITPTGNLDPFALRRQAIGSIRIIIHKGYHIPLPQLFESGYEALGAIAGKVPFETLRGTLSDFIATRFKFLMMEEGHNQEFVNSILPYVIIDIYDGFMRLRALETQKSIEDFRRLMVGFKRVYNITKTISDEGTIDPSLFEHKEEQDLYDLLEAKKGDFHGEMQTRRYEDAINVLVGFKETIDRYFDRVFVMVSDEKVKANRLALLAKIKDMFLKYGDFSKIRVEELQ